MTTKLLIPMALLLSCREREILELVEDLGDPHSLEIVAQYHKRYEAPIEPFNVLRTLDRLVEKGCLSAQTRPALDGVLHDKRMHFMVADREATRLDPASAPSSRPDDIEDLVRLVRLALDKQGRT